MKIVKVTFANGDVHIGSIKGTNEEITKYYLGNLFDRGVYPIENMQLATKVEFEYEFKFQGRAKGSVGICYIINDTIYAENEKMALLELYNHYEHIALISVNGVKKES